MSVESERAEISGALAPFRDDPDGSAIFFDLDGTLAPIVDRPDAVQVPEGTLSLLSRLADRYPVAGVVTGRQGLDARRILGLGRLTYIGNHGYELLEPGMDEASPSPALGESAGLVAEFTDAALDGGMLAAAGLRLEDKGEIVALHWRGSDFEPVAEAAAKRLGALAERCGLATHRGRKVIELRPPVELDKGVALAALLERLRPARAFYAGDDRTDADAFAALAELSAAGGLEAIVRVAVLSEEGPEDLADGAELAVEGPQGFVAVLEALLDA